MTIPRRKPAESYGHIARRSLPYALRCAGAILCRRIVRTSILLLVIVLTGMSIDGAGELAKERDRADRAQEQLDALVAWHRDGTVRVVLTGNPAQVANLAGQVAARIR